MMQPTKTYTLENETGCCPRADVQGWDSAEVVWEGKKFIKDSTFNIFHIPLNMKQVVTRMMKKIQGAQAESPADEWVMLSYDSSLWKSELFISVTKDVLGAENVAISGTFLTKVFEGPYRDAGKWYREMFEHAKSKGKEIKKLYFFYTTCPKCAKHYGKNYSVGFAQV